MYRYPPPITYNQHNTNNKRVSPNHSLTTLKFQRKQNISILFFSKYSKASDTEFLMNELIHFHDREIHPHQKSIYIPLYKLHNHKINVLLCKNCKQRKTKDNDVFISMIIKGFHQENMPMGHGYVRPCPKVIQIFSCSTQLSMEIQFSINTEITKKICNFLFRPSKPVIYPAKKC